MFFTQSNNNLNNISQKIINDNLFIHNIELNEEKKNYLEIIIMVHKKKFEYFKIFKKNFKSWTNKNKSINKKNKTFVLRKIWKSN